MILKAYREKSNQKIINNSLSKRESKFTCDKISTVGVLLNADEYNDIDSFLCFFKELNLNSPKHKCFTYVTDKTNVLNSWDAVFDAKDFGWKGRINNTELKTFIDTDFDVLISYYKMNITELHLVTALSKANLKLGISDADERLNDIIINVQPSVFDTFKEEFKKYLTTLNKL